MPGVPANAFSELKAKFKSLIKKKDKKPRRKQDVETPEQEKEKEAVASK